MNRLSIIAIIAAVILVGVTIQHQALASIWSDTLAGTTGTNDFRPLYPLTDCVK
jgi:hypothetical protein